jgi:hypothetical protein
MDFGVIALTEGLDVIDTWIKGGEHFISLGPAYILRITGFVVLCIVAARTRNLTFHALFVIGGLIYELAFFSRYYYSLS